MNVFFWVNVASITISTVSIALLFCTWFLIFFKKETIMKHIYGPRESFAAFQKLFFQHIINIPLAIGLGVDIMLSLSKIPTESLIASVFAVGVILSVCVPILVIIAVSKIIYRLRKNIKPT